jgi:ATP-binding cassette subfamily A (ABC1) protein 3
MNNFKLNKKIDSSVQKEITRIKNSNLMDLSIKEPLIVNQIVKLFKKSNKMIAAVDNLSFGVKAQKCFGLLGLNGAGKTTTFKIIVGDLNPNQGDVLINGLSIQKDRYNARQNLGYCPQFDCLPEYLTVKETIYLFAKLRGIPNNLAKNITMDMLEIFQLNEFEKVLVQNLRYALFIITSLFR